ncbi:hypothetical protein F2Q70_00040722 [Brassica cretica]|uniref:PHD-type domain-containing protein n=1 Tax=Brassica cretica TaxID=69181 RepID=A0A8S9K0M7_BRACR|nr:hypothetical protein F2Q70_00040722 [Brassica cretica]
MNFRHTLYPAYKSNRPPTPDTVVQGLQYLKASIKAMSVKVIEVPGVEADDVIGTLAMRSIGAGYKVRVVSPDKDFFQILSPSLRLLRIAPRGSEMVSFGVEDFAKKFGNLKPAQFVDIIALAGDKSDNIPGIDGIGNVHAVELLSRFGTLENLLQSIDEIKEGKLKESLIAHADQAMLSKKLALLRTDLPDYIVPFETRDLTFKKPETVSSGPYLCPKHTKCYSCGSKVPGNGQSLRWFLGYTCCDACGRLFGKGNYCPVCLKVYRDSEATPMVCCDYCQRWVHCLCDGISDEKYMQFQVDGNLQYKCSTCRGESYQVKDLEDAVQEIWKRKDIEDKELIASLRASARVVGKTGGAPVINQPGSSERKVAEKVMVSGEEEKPLRVLRIKSSRPQDSDSEKLGKHSKEQSPVKAKKLVISIGPRKAGVTNPMSCDTSNLASKSNGKHGKLQSEETASQEEQERSVLRKSSEEKRGSQSEVGTSKGEGGGDSNGGQQELQKDSKRLLKLKIKTHNPESQEREAPRIVYERSKSGKGHRSKRKRASPPAEKSAFNEDEDVSLSRDDSLLDEMLDASWILKKLGKDAKGKKVQIHEASDNTWEKGVVSEVGGGGTSKLMVTLENGKVKTVELGKQGVRFVAQKQKRTRT